MTCQIINKSSQNKFCFEPQNRYERCYDLADKIINKLYEDNVQYITLHDDNNEWTNTDDLSVIFRLANEQNKSASFKLMLGSNGMILGWQQHPIEAYEFQIHFMHGHLKLRRTRSEIISDLVWLFCKHGTNMRKEITYDLEL